MDKLLRVVSLQRKFNCLTFGDRAYCGTMAMLVKYGTSLAKLGLLGGAVGVTSHYGVWGDTEQGVQAYKQLQELVEPYTPEEISQLKPMSSLGLDSRSDNNNPRLGTIKNSVVEGYNKGVQKTFEFVSDAPSLVSGGMDSLTDTVKKQFKE